MPSPITQPTFSQPTDSESEQLKELVRRSYEFESALVQDTGESWIFGAFVSQATVCMQIPSFSEWRLYGKYVPNLDNMPKGSAMANGGSGTLPGEEKPARYIDMLADNVIERLYDLALQPTSNISVIRGITFGFSCK